LNNVKKNENGTGIEPYKNAVEVKFTKFGYVDIVGIDNKAPNLVTEKLAEYTM
jgi:hypothetical protein